MTGWTARNADSGSTSEEYSFCVNTGSFIFLTSLGSAEGVFRATQLKTSFVEQKHSLHSLVPPVRSCSGGKRRCWLELELLRQWTVLHTSESPNVDNKLWIILQTEIRRVWYFGHHHTCCTTATFALPSRPQTKHQLTVQPAAHIVVTSAGPT